MGETPARRATSRMVGTMRALPGSVSQRVGSPSYGDERLLSISHRVMTTAATPSLFPLESVRLREGLFAAAQRTDLEYLLGLEAERLLAPFRREAGIATTAEPYGNWESMGLDGHIGGHALAAASLMWAATGDERAAELARQLVEGLRECQERLGTGYVGGIPGGTELWAQIRTIASQAQTWDLG